MRRNWLLVLVVLVVVSLAEAMLASRQEGTTENSDVAKVVTDLDHQWLTAATKRDINALQSIFADGFTEVHAGGEVVDKARQISQIAAATTKLDIHPEDIVVRYASPDVAVVMDKTVVKGTRQGKDITGTYRVLRVFVKQQGKWRAAGAGLTRIAAEQSSTQ